MSKYQKLLFATLVAAAAVAPSIASAATPLQMARQDCRANGSNSADCACLSALREGTVDALQDFKARYGGAGTVCNTQASTTREDYDPASSGERRHTNYPIQ